MPAMLERSSPHRQYPIRAFEDVGVLRRAVAALAARLPGLRAGDAELVATELATNILGHTSGGHVLVRPFDGGIELIAVDYGAPGLSPGAGGLGVGLAAVRRRAATFEFYRTRQGSVVFARLLPAQQAVTTRTEPWRWAAVTVPRGGSGDSGDAWAVATAGTALAALIVDGLGHGPEAATAATAAISAFDQARLFGEPITEFTRRAHEAMRGTRGGVLGICLIDHDRLTYAGVGNTTGRILAYSRGQHLIGQHGTLGTHLTPPTSRSTSHSWPAAAALILTTDGIDTRWDPTTYPDLLRRHPAVIAATLHRDHARGTDDATVLVISDTRTPTPAGGAP